MITFNDIYDASRKERYSENLQQLSENFILDVAEYLKDKKEMSSKKEDIFSDVVDKTKKQLENAITLFKELMNRRRRKILNLILIASETGISKKDFDNMLDFEKKLFEDIMELMSHLDKKISVVLNGKNEFEKEPKTFENEESTDFEIIFKEDVGEFLNLEGEKVGPFKKGEITKILKEVGKILIESGKAELKNN